MDDRQQAILRHIGAALIALGLIDIGVMAYCIAHHVSYSSSFNVFAVIAGIFVWRRHPWWLNWVPRAMAFLLVSFAAGVLVVLLVVPMALIGVVIRLHPGQVLAGVLAWLGFMGFLVWALRQFQLAGTVTPRASLRAGALGILPAIGLVVLAAATSIGEPARTAATLAQAKLGPGYRYWVSHLSFSGGHGRAKVLGYDSSTIQSVEVEW